MGITEIISCLAEDESIEFSKRADHPANSNTRLIRFKKGIMTLNVVIDIDKVFAKGTDEKMLAVIEEGMTRCRDDFFALTSGGVVDETIITIPSNSIIFEG